MFNSQWYDSWAVAGTILQQSLTRYFNSSWHDYSTVTGMILQQSLAQLFNSGWHNCSTVTGTILQQWLARFFNSHGQEFFFYAGRILQQWKTLLKNHATYQEYNTWSKVLRVHDRCFPSVLSFFKNIDLVWHDLFHWYLPISETWDILPSVQKQTDVTD